MPNRTEKPAIVYVRRPARAGEPAVSSVTLSDGTIVRRVDETVHQRALANASRRYREGLNGK